MKTIKLLFAACAALFLAQGAFAAKEAKAVLTDSGTTLKFVYDEKSYGTKGKNWFSVREAEDQEQTIETNKPWYDASSAVTRVVFDDSFAAYKPKNCYQWFYYFDKLTRVVGIENLDVSSATNLGFMFGFCKALQTIDISQFDTSAAKSIMGMFNGCAKLTTIYASDRFVTTALTEKNEQVFSGCSTNLKGGNGTVWSSTNVKADFARCDIPDYPGYFTVKEPTVVWNSADTSLTFYFKPAKELPSGSTYQRFGLPANGVPPDWIKAMSVSGKPTKVTIDASFADCRPSNCYMWFDQMSGVTDIKGLYNLNVSKVTDSYGFRMMFRGCSKVTKLDLSSFDTANVPSFQSMFEGCSALTTIYATEKFVVKSTASSPDMFANCNSLKGGNGTTWSSDKATDKTFAKIDKSGQSGYFTAAPIAVSAVNTLTFYADGADHSGSGLTIYSVAAAETGNPLWKDFGSTVTKAVFDPSFKGYRPTSCAGWFEGFGKMTAVEGLDNVNTSEATSFSFMFYDCGNLTSLNLESFDTANVKDTSNMFNGCSKLATITVSDGFVMTQVTSSPNMFANCNALKGGNGTAWSSDKPADKTYAKIDTATTPGYFTAKVALAVWNSSGKTLTFYYNVPKKIPTYDGQFSVADAEKIDLTKDEVPWYSTCAGSATKVDFDASFAAYRPKKCVKWFAKFENLAYIRGIENLNVSAAVDLTSMFYGCGKLRVLDLSNFTTSKVTSMISMFAECSALESIYATEYFTTVKLDPSFGGYGMFHGCTSIRGENGTTYDSAKTAQAYAHIDEAGNKGYFSMPPTAVLSSDGKTLTFYADGTAHVGKATYSVGAELMDEPDVQRPWINDAKGSVTTVAFDSSFRKCRPVHCGGWFSGFTKLTNVKSAKNLTLSSATYLGFMFQNCSALESLYVFAWDTSKVENMKQMFNGCTKLKKVVVSADGFSTASVTESSSMFNGCSALTGGYGTVYDSGKTDATYARGDTKTQKGYFTYPAVARYNSKTLTFYCDGKDHSGSVGIVYDVNDSAYDVEQDWSSHKGEATAVEFDASFLNYRPTSCYGWFTDFSALTAVSGLENLDVSRCEYLTSLFEGCSVLTTLDLATFDTAKVQEFDGMFMGCTRLKTILASDKFSLASKTSAADMFDGCDALVGANGTAYATAKVVDASYAHVDAVDNPGYFTGLLASVAVYDDMTKTLTFYYDNLGHSGAGKEVFSVQEASDSDPTSPVVPWSGKTDVTKVVFDKSFAAFQPKHCAQWFMGFSAVTEFVGLENLDVSKATRLSSMFKNCSSVTTLDLSTWNTADVTHMTGMFSGCSELAAIYASPAFTTAKVTTTAGKTGTFTGCTKLPNFDPAKLTADQAYIGAGGYLSEKTISDTPRAIYDAAAKTLTFVYDKSHHYGEKTYLVADAEKIDPSSEDVPWYTDCHENVTKVVFDTAFAGYRPTNLGGWFKYFTALTEIEGMANLDTSAAASMKMMFSGCAVLTALNVSGFNTANVTDMSYLFWECKALTALDVSSFVTDKVKDMTWMFKDSKKLKTIYAGAGFTAAGADGTSMFHGCSALVGGAGTSYAGQPSAIQQGKEYARIDNPPDAPGFLTIAAVAVLDTAAKTLTFYADSADHSAEGKVFSVAAACAQPADATPSWWDDCKDVVTKVVFDPSVANFKPMHCSHWFWAFKQLTDIEGFRYLDVSRATSFYYMFNACEKLTELDLAGFKTKNVDDMTFMFGYCKALKTIYASADFDVGNVTKAGGMFTDCLVLEGGAGTKYDTAHAGGTEYARIDDPDNGKPGYFTEEKAAVVEIPYPEADTTLVFTGSEQSGFKNVDPRLSHSGDVAATDAGNYGATFKLPDDTATETYQWVGGGTSGFSATWSITQRDVSDSGVTFAEIPDQKHTGSAITPPVTMTFNGVERTLGTDFTVAYSDNEKVGTAHAVVTGVGNFTGTRTLDFKIVEETPKTVVKIEKPVKVGISLFYTGSAQTGIQPYDARLTVEGFTSATDAASYKAIFTLPGDTETETYTWADGTTDPTEVEWCIQQRDVSDAAVTFANIPDQTHTGAEIMPPVTMTYPEGVVRTEGTDYTVAYADNKEIGTAKATVTGSGNFTGTRVLTFQIVEAKPKTEVKIDRPTAIADLVYTGAAQKGVEFDERLTPAAGSVTEATDAKADYAATFPLPIETETETFKWADDTTEPVKVVWAIAPRPADDESVAYAEIADQYYTGAAIEPPVVMTFGGVVCTPGEDYEATYSNNVEVGTGTVYVAGLGNFTGTKAFDFAIKAVAAGTSVVIFDANGGIATETTRVVTNGTAVGALPVAYSYTHEFKGWFDAKDGGAKVEPGRIVTSNVTFFAQWQEPPTGSHFVFFDANGGKIEEFLRFVADGQPVGGLPEATREGFALKGWFTAVEGGDEVTAATPVKADMIAHAQWTAVAPGDHVVTFDPNGGTCSETNRTVAHGAPLGELPAATRRGCVLEGWFVETAAGAFEVTAETPVTADATVRAQWIVPERVLVGETVLFTLADLGVTMEGTSSAKVEGLPKGLKYKNGVIAGVPTETLDFVTQTIFARVTTKIGNGKVETLQPVRLQIDAECLYTNTVGEVVSRSLGANVKSAKNLPKGLKFDKNTGIVSGTPTAAGVSIVTLTMTDKTTQTFQWLVEPPVEVGVLESVSWKVEDCAVTVMQGVVQNGWTVSVPYGAKLTVSGLPSGLKYKDGIIAGTPTKAGNSVVTFKTVAGGVTKVERVSIIVEANAWTGNWFGLQADTYDNASLNVSVAVSTNGTVKLVCLENSVKTTATVKNLDASGTTATLAVNGRACVLDFANETMTVKDASGAYVKIADLCEAVPSLTAKDVTTFVLEEIADGTTNAYAYVTATYNAKKASFVLSGKLWDGTAVKGTTYALDKTSKTGGLYLAPVLLADKTKVAVYLELSDDGGWCRVRENGEPVSIGKDGTTPWSAGFAAAKLKGSTLYALEPEAKDAVVLVPVDAVSSPHQEENAIVLSAKDQQTKLAANGLAKLTLNDADGWKWVCELVPVDNDAKTQFRGIATGTRKGYPTLTCPVFVR